MTGSGSVTVRGEWPGLVTLRSGWWKGVARPIHDGTLDALLRVERASADFVGRSAAALVDLGAPTVSSPPLMPGTDRVYRAAGFAPHVDLTLMERDLRGVSTQLAGVRVSNEDDRAGALRIDDLAFEGEWRVGRLGLQDALAATPDAVMLTLDGDDGFSIVGVSTEVGYLQRIAVDPAHQGRGRGRLLLRASMAWARSRGARTMLLNTQTDNDKATRMYRSESFEVLTTRLTIHRFAP